MPFFLRRVLREPLSHFVLLGALVFGIDHGLAARDAKPNVIEVGPDILREAGAIFKAGMGREPSAAELQVLRARWIDNEVLYREGLALRVDQGDAAIRERVIFKALNVMQANLVLPAVDEPGLRAWFEQHRANYDTPARIDFLEAVLIGDKGAQAAGALAAALNSGVQSDAQKNSQSGLRIFKARPRDTLVTSYGAGFADALDNLPPSTWSVLPSKEGLRVVRLDAIVAGTVASYDDLAQRIYQDWKDATMQQLRTVAVRKLGQKYTVIQGADPGPPLQPALRLEPRPELLPAPGPALAVEQAR